MRVMIACGGTGGHFYPGYVLGRKMIERGHEVLFVVRQLDPACRTLREEDLPFAELDLLGMPRRPSWRIFTFTAKLALSLRVARNMVRAFRPAVVAGMGGYLTFPVSAAARMAGAPLLLHESNAALGLANRLCLRWASLLALGLPLERMPASTPTSLTGTPIRPELWRPLDPEAARAALGLESRFPTLLVFGGSQGARGVNLLVPRALELVAQRHPGRMQALHLSGPKDEAEVRAAYSRIRGLSCAVLPYLDRMHLGYAAADLALCRSGASTLAELRAQEKPALLIPYPSAAGGHQEINARLLERAGAAQSLAERGLTPEDLAKRLEELLIASYPDKLEAMARAYARLDLPDPARCADVLADVVESLGKRYLERTLR